MSYHERSVTNILLTLSASDFLSMRAQQMALQQSLQQSQQAQPGKNNQDSPP